MYDFRLLTCTISLTFFLSVWIFVLDRLKVCSWAGHWGTKLSKPVHVVNADVPSPRRNIILPSTVCVTPGWYSIGRKQLSAQCVCMPLQLPRQMFVFNRQTRTNSSRFDFGSVCHSSTRTKGCSFIIVQTTETVISTDLPNIKITRRHLFACQSSVVISQFVTTPPKGILDELGLTLHGKQVSEVSTGCTVLIYYVNLFCMVSNWNECKTL